MTPAIYVWVTGLAGVTLILIAVLVVGAIVEDALDKLEAATFEEGEE